jgi:S-adenosylmethionine-diacylgycerolhomoserine-N-methlytransferase
MSEGPNGAPHGKAGEARQHMDAMYRYQRYIYDVTRKYYLLGRDQLILDLKPPAGGTILEIGCGTGRNLILAAKRYPSCRLYGFDISSEMLKTARANIAAAGLSDRVTVAEGDATDFDVKAMFGIEAVDRAFISYALSMIPPWQPVPKAGLASLKPGGRLHIVDFGQQEGWPPIVRTGLHGWLRKFSVHPRKELEMVLRDLATASGASLTFNRPYRGYAEYAVLTRKDA